MVAHRRRKRRSYRPGPPQHLSFGIQTTPSRRTFTHYQRSPRTIPAKRSMKKDLLPGMWDTAVGGHIGVNEKVEDALKREASKNWASQTSRPVFWVTTFGKVPANGNWFFLFYVPVTTISTSITMKWTNGVLDSARIGRGHGEK